MGVTTPGRREYWKFLMKALVRHRRAFAEAVELAIMDHHFRAVARGL